jgi:kynurenine formamidase
MIQHSTDETRVTATEFNALFQTVSRWRHWGAHDELGALHYLTPEKVAMAAGLVFDGTSVSLSQPLNMQPAAHNPHPTVYSVTLYDDPDSESVRFAKDYVGVDYHNDTHTHVDALCHVAYRGLLYNGHPDGTVTAQGATVDTIDVLKDGLVGRGVLLDVPRVRGVPWLEPGQHIFRDDLEAAERAEGITVAEGDILLIRTGHAQRLGEREPWDTAKAKAGLHPTAMPFLAERRVAALGSDGNSDTAPSSTEGVAFPVHVLALNAMGLHLLDYLQFEELRGVCERTGRWAFLFVAVPLRIAVGTGSPINPIAIF